jgi:beta-lactamase class D
MSINSHLSTCVGTQSPKYLEMAQGHISLSTAKQQMSFFAIMKPGMGVLPFSKTNIADVRETMKIKNVSHYRLIIKVTIENLYTNQNYTLGQM